MNFIRRIPVFLKEVRIELRKVNWPSRQETVRYTLIVIGMSAAVAAFLGALDMIFSAVLYRFVL